jgi:hypothetical protein
MIDLINKIKSAIIYTLIVLVIGVISGYCIAVFTTPNPPNPEIIQDDHPISTIIVTPQTADEYVKAFNSPIEIQRKLTGEIYDIRATDGYKETHVRDRIIIPIITPKYLFSADIYAGYINSKSEIMYGVTGSYFLNSRLFANVGIAGSSDGIIIRGSIGIALY